MQKFKKLKLNKEGQICPFCNFSQLKKEGNEIFCSLCGYGYKGCT